MRAVHVVVAVALLVGCRNDAQEADRRRAGPPTVRAPSPPPSPAASPGDAGLVFVRQTAESDCGPAAITIALRYYGRPTTLDAAKAAMHFHDDATSALDLVNVAKANGLGVIGVSFDADKDAALSALRTGDILHFDFNHFVVFDALAADGIRLMDPGVGRVVLDRAAFASHFTGVALLFERSPEALAARMRSIGVSAAP